MLSNIKTNEMKKIVLSLSNKGSIYNKGTINKIVLNNKEYFQISLYTTTQVFHENIEIEELESKLKKLFEELFNQIEIFTDNNIYRFKKSKKGKILSNISKNTTIIEVNPHNKIKNYIIKEGDIIPPLIDLGVMTSEGKIVKAYYDKYKQINKFLEIIQDTINNNQIKNIIDFGCGKSYLTFILYYYLVEVKKLDVNIVGLDLKKEVIEDCNKIAIKYKYNNLKFLYGDISTYKPNTNIDMIITLHACDTATDYALYHAIKLECKYILSVPCCQHEINSQLDGRIFNNLTKYGLLKERLSSLLTD